jgi:hypothetical protein
MLAHRLLLGNLLFQQKYENGCIDKTFKEAKIENLD